MFINGSVWTACRDLTFHWYLLNRQTRNVASIPITATLTPTTTPTIPLKDSPCPLVPVVGP